MPDMRLAAGGPNDVDACVELWRTATAARDGIEPADVPETVLARARGKLESAAPSWVLARDPGGTPVGFGLTLSPGSGYTDDPPDAAYVALLAVAPRTQGHGVGGALLDAMTTELSAAGMNSAVLHVLDDEHRCPPPVRQQRMDRVRQPVPPCAVRLVGAAVHDHLLTRAVTMTMRWLEMDDGVRLTTWQSGAADVDQFPVVLVHGGPGLPDYLAPVATLIDDMAQVHRYDQRGTGGSQWDGPHTVARHVQDLGQLIDAWGHDRVVLVGHSYGTDLTSFFVRAHPERVARVVYLCGPFVGPWRDPTRTAERARRSDSQQVRLEELEVLASRTDEEEIEYLALSWFTDHGDPNHAWEWAMESAHALRPINWTMNAQLNADKRTAPLEATSTGCVRSFLPVPRSSAVRKIPGLPQACGGWESSWAAT